MKTNDTNQLMSILKAFSVNTQNSANITNGYHALRANDVVFDSGASCSVVGNKKLIQDYRNSLEKKFVVANGEVIQSTGYGYMSLVVNKFMSIEINVYYLSTLPINLISILDIVDLGLQVTFTPDHLLVLQSDESYTLASRNMNSRLYVGQAKHTNDLITSNSANLVPQGDLNSVDNGLNLMVNAVRPGRDNRFADTDSEQVIANPRAQKDLYYYHLVTNHMSINQLKSLVNQLKINTRPTEEAVEKIRNCQACIKVNSKAIPHNSSTQRPATRRLERVHSDTMGSFFMRGLPSYITTLIDEYSLFTIAIVTNSKSVLPLLVDELKKLNNKFAGEAVANFRLDQARELPSAEVLLDIGITKEVIPGYTPQMNGLAESHNRLILRQIRFVTSSFPGQLMALLTLFELVVEYSVYNKNHVPLNRVVGKEGYSAYELFYETRFKPSFHQFGVDVLVKIGSQQEGNSVDMGFHKLTTNTVPGFFVGYGQDSNSFWIKFMHGNYPVKCVANVTFLGTMKNIYHYFEQLDKAALAETQSIVDNLAKYDDFAELRNTPVTTFSNGQLNLVQPNNQIELFQHFLNNQNQNNYNNFGDPFENFNPAAFNVHNADPTVNNDGYSQLVSVREENQRSIKSGEDFTNSQISLYATDEHNARLAYPNTETGRLKGLEPPDISIVDGFGIASKELRHPPKGSSHVLGVIRKPLKVMDRRFESGNTHMDNRQHKPSYGVIENNESPTGQAEKSGEKSVDADYEGREESLNNGWLQSGNALNTGITDRQKLGKLLVRELAKIKEIYPKLLEVVYQHKLNPQILEVPDLLDQPNNLLSMMLVRCTNGDTTANGLTLKPNIDGNSRILKPPTKYIYSLNIDGDGYIDGIYSVERHIDPFDNNWRASMQKELDTFKSMNVYKVVSIPVGAKVIPLTWVHSFKNDSGKGDQYKSRLVIQGFRQIAGVDYHPEKISSPVTDLTSIRVLTVIATELSYDIHHVDIKSAYLNASLSEDTPIFVRPPTGVEIKPGKCWQLLKAVYGLKQLSYEWFNHLSKKLISIGLSRCGNSGELFKYENKHDKIFVAVYVDDLFIVASSNDIFQTILSKLQLNYELTYLGTIKKYLGVSFEHTANGYRLHQREFVQSIIDTFSLDSVSGQRLPKPPTSDFNKGDLGDNIIIEKQEQLLNDMEKKVYQKGVGMLQWACMNTRPDIAFATNCLGVKASKPSVKDYKMLLHCIRYLKSTLHLGLEYNRGQTDWLGKTFVTTAFSDASFAPPGDRKSISGYVVYLNSNLVYWGSKKQRVITSSSMGCEIIALGETVDRAFYVRDLVKSLDLPYSKVLVFEDNQPAIHLSYNHKTSHSRRSVDISMKRIRSLVLEEKDLAISYIKSLLNIADLFTKALGTQQFETLRNSLFSNGNTNQLTERLSSHLHNVPIVDKPLSGLNLLNYIRYWDRYSYDDLMKEFLDQHQVYEA